MKNIIYIFTALLIMVSCDSDDAYEDLNRDPNNPTTVKADALFTSATVSLFDALESTNVNNNIFRMVSQYWTETQYIDEANFNLQNRNIPQNFWSTLYTNVLYDLKNAKSLTTNTAKLAQIQVIEIYTWQILVDTFGDIPYTDALQGQDGPSPSYDDAETIYNTLLTNIDVARSGLSGTGFVDSDVIYGGDLVKWSKFANSIKLKLANRIGNTALATAAAAGAFTSNADNANITYEGSTPNTNPLWVSLVQSGRNDFVPAKTIVNVMNGLSDPRRAVFFKENLGPDTYLGGVYGDSNAYGLFTHIGGLLLEPTRKGVLLDYAEVEFLKAAAGIGSAATHYENGITASFADWGLEAEAAAYIALNPFSLQSLAHQFWIAMYNRGFEGWSVYRMYTIHFGDGTDAGHVFQVPADTQNPIPTRFTYPVNEQTLNQANYDAASTAIGGDTQTTKIFWDND